MLTRRDMLKGLMLAGGFYLMPLGGRGWALAAPQATDRRLIVILMRGAVDGLSVVAPYREPNYYRLRSSITLPPPGQTDGLLDLDGTFGLHPSLAPILPLWQSGKLAFIHASGSPATTRSHFEAQDNLETAMLNSAMASQGWLNGFAQALPDNHSPTRALSLGNLLPKIFQGPYNVSTIPVGIQAGKANNKMASNPQMEGAFSKLYGNNPELNGLYQQGINARQDVMQSLEGEGKAQQEMVAASRGAAAAEGFPLETAKAGNLIRKDSRIQLLFMDVGGWDTHVRQGNAKGQLANKLEKFGEGIAALVQALGPAYQNTAILIMSEFGRTVAENGNGGTDHGHGNVAWLLGGGVKGGMWTRWPGLNEDQLYERRDLAITTDFRSIIGTVGSRHLGLSDQQLAKIIPGYQPDTALSGIIS